MLIGCTRLPSLPPQRLYDQQEHLLLPSRRIIWWRRQAPRFPLPSGDCWTANVSKTCATPSSGPLATSHESSSFIRPVHDACMTYPVQGDEAEGYQGGRDALLCTPAAVLQPHQGPVVPWRLPTHQGPPSHGSWLQVTPALNSINTLCPKFDLPASACGVLLTPICTH